MPWYYQLMLSEAQNEFAHVRLCRSIQQRALEWVQQGIRSVVLDCGFEAVHVVALPVG
jgi:hypothetical protein